MRKSKAARFVRGQRVLGPDLPESNYLDAVDNISRAELASSVWEFDYANPGGLWEVVGNVIPINALFLREVEALKKKISKSNRIDPITVDTSGPWPWVEGQHRLKVAIDLGWDTIPGFFRVT